MRAMIAAALALGALAFGSAQAAEDSGPRCNPSGTQMEMNVCAHDDYMHADAALNRAYRTRMAAEKAEPGDTGAALLLKAQRAWLAYRDAECTYEAAPNTGGSIYPLVYDECLADLTEARTKRLEQKQQ